MHDGGHSARSVATCHADHRSPDGPDESRCTEPRRAASARSGDRAAAGSCSRPRSLLSAGWLRLVRAITVGQIPTEGGFFGWHIHAPFDTSEVKTVAVFFKSKSFRRDLEKQLTEAVDQGDQPADALQGRRQSREGRLAPHGHDHLDDKNLVVEAPTNLAARAQHDDHRLGELDS